MRPALNRISGLCYFRLFPIFLTTNLKCIQTALYISGWLSGKNYSHMTYSLRMTMWPTLNGCVMSGFAYCTFQFGCQENKLCDSLAYNYGYHNYTGINLASCLAIGYSPGNNYIVVGKS